MYYLFLCINMYMGKCRGQKRTSGTRLSPSICGFWGLNLNMRVKSLYGLSHLTGLVKCFISNHFLSQKLIVPTCNSTRHHNAAGIIFWSLFHPSLETMQPNANSSELAKLLTFSLMLQHHQ